MKYKKSAGCFWSITAFHVVHMNPPTICEHAKRLPNVLYQARKNLWTSSVVIRTLVVKKLLSDHFDTSVVMYMVSRTSYSVWNIALSRKQGSFKHSPFDALSSKNVGTWHHIMLKWSIWYKMWFIWWVLSVICQMDLSTKPFPTSMNMTIFSGLDIQFAGN